MFTASSTDWNSKRSLLALALLLGFATTSFADSNVYQTLLKSTAMIVADDSVGSGALVDAQRRLIFTNYHVVGEAEEVQVLFPQYDAEGQLMTNRRDVMNRIDQIGIAGRVIARDAKRDLALVEVERIPDGTLEIQMANKSITPGERVHSIGNPGVSSGMWVYTTGTVRQVYDKSYELEDNQTVQARVVETDAPINPGDSGGPVVNDKNELVIR